jgi:pimeloyl-ACP methyl ester carboxylesterase
VVRLLLVALGVTPFLLLLGVLAMQRSAPATQPALDCRGNGAVTVVFEHAPSEVDLFSRLRNDVAHEQRTCIITAAGGKDLHALFATAREKPPFLFVVTSAGSGPAAGYALRHRENVMGLVVIGPDAGAPAGARVAIVPRDPSRVLTEVAAGDAIFDIIEAARRGTSLPLTMRDLLIGAGECVDFSSRGRLKADVPFEVRLPRGMVLRLRPERATWGIDVSPESRPRDDYMSVVSPPFQTAPQMMIGAGYGVTAAQSVQIDRELRFAINERDYAFARLLHDVPASEMKMAKFRALGKGLLHLAFASHKVAADGTLEWIQFRGRACVPRESGR